MSFTIHPFAEHDYPALAAILAAVFERHLSAETLQHEDRARPAHCHHGGYVAEVDGQVVGFAEYTQYPGAYHPHKFEVSVAVLPGFRGRGIGGAMYLRLLDAIRPYDPIALNAGVREDWTDCMAFAERRGYIEQMRNWESYLDLTAFEPEKFATVAAEVRPRGYELVPYPALADLPDLARQIHALVQALRRDIPSPQPATDMPFEQWVKTLERPTFFPDAYWLARKDGRLVGISNIWKTDDEGVLETGITGVLREHRGSGVAKALKISALAAVKAKGYRSVKTWNAKSNAPMLAVNEWLGFVRRPGWIAYVKELQPE